MKLGEFMRKIYVLLLMILGLPLVVLATDLTGSSILSERQMMINNIIAPQNPWSIGVQGFVTPNPYCNTKTVSWLLPAVIYRTPKFVFYDTYGRYELIRTDHTATDIVGQIFPVSYNSKYGDSWAMQQLNNRYMSIMLGLEERFITPYGFFAVSGQKDITGDSAGFMGRIKYEMPLLYGNVNQTFMIKPEIGLQYDSQNLNNYYFGISQSESVNSGLPVYSATDSIGPYEGINFIYVANQRVNFFLLFQLYQMPNAVFDSPMVVKSKSVLSSQLVATYTF